MSVRRLVPALATVLLLAGCVPVTSGSSSSLRNAPTCDELLSRVVVLMRAGQVGDGADELSVKTDALRACTEHYSVYADYASSEAMASQFGPGTCVDLAQRGLEPAAIELLRQDGLCLADATAAPTDGSADEVFGQPPGGGISWETAINHVGTHQRVCGPLAGTGSSRDDVFLNLGVDYPDPARFTIVIWDIGGVEPIAAGSTLCTSGTVTAYEGVAQIELRDPADVTIYSD